jgi:N-acetylmuramoyl-L-alanine amidase
MPFVLTSDRRCLEGIDSFDSPNKGKLARLRFLVLHYTAGPTLESTRQRFLDQTSKVSAHLIIGRDGAVAQLVDFDRAAWHAGKSVLKAALPPKNVIGLNKFSIGIELVNAGHLSKSESGKYRTWYGAEVDPDDVVKVNPKDPASFGRRYWHRFPPEQIAACQDIATLLCREFGLEEILGHSDVAPGRKTDPGPAFPLANLRSIIYGRHE